MQTDLLIFSLFYLLVAIGVVYPPPEFLSAGITIQAIFSRTLGSENEQFIQYHLRRTTLTLFVHFMIPATYVILLYLFFEDDIKVLSYITSKQFHPIPLLIKAAFTLPAIALYKVSAWSSNNWEDHPISRNLMKFNENSNWATVANDVNVEFRRVDKLCIQTNSITKVVATDNWILKVTPYTIHVSHQSDSSLIVASSDTHNITHFNTGEIQFINIEVKSSRRGVDPFVVRINALDFKELQDKYARPITILPNVTFHKTLIDRFIDTFKEQVNLNETYETHQDLDSCIGCMQVPANVKLRKLCIDDSDQPSENCVNCYCRPMWCVDCMARWFASRQDENSPDTWLANKCTCPVCRARFCIYDVSLVRMSSL